VFHPLLSLHTFLLTPLRRCSDPIPVNSASASKGHAQANFRTFSMLKSSPSIDNYRTTYTAAMYHQAFSPTLTASSSSTVAQSLSADVDMTMDKGVQDFSEMFNFDEFESSVRPYFQSPIPHSLWVPAVPLSLSHHDLPESHPIPSGA